MRFLPNNDLPSRVRVLVLGGGIHGVGVLHDLATRGWQDIHLLEKSTLGKGTSSRSTKLIHGGLRYLKRLSDFPLVTQSLREREWLLKIAPDIVHPVELYFPILKKGGENQFMVWLGLNLYQSLFRSESIKGFKTVSAEECVINMPIFDTTQCKKIYSFWDGQTDDLALVHKVACSAVELGAGITEQAEVLEIRESTDGWEVLTRCPDGSVRTVSCLYIVNALGPWSHQVLKRSRITPLLRGMNDKGSHIVFPDIGLKKGLFLQSLSDNRVVFLLPWQGLTLMGTTESYFDQNPDEVYADEKEIDYMLSVCNPFLKEQLHKKNICFTFAGLRWLPIEKKQSLSRTSREHFVTEHYSGRGAMLSIYGGKLTSYRALSETIGDRILSHFGDKRKTGTLEAENWTKEKIDLSYDVEILKRRF